MRPAIAIILDLVCVAAFVLIGRASHTEGETVAGFAKTAWPFLAGLLAGWLVTRSWRRPSLGAGAGVWLATVALGMALRAVTRQGIAFTFVLVALAFFALTMLGWRVVARRWRTA